MLSVDSWQPEVMRRALDCGATMINAADGLQDPAMVRLAAHSDVPVVVPFVWGADPKASRHVTGDPAEVICGWFRRSLRRWEEAGIERGRLIIDPGTGFGPPDWEWEDRYRYQKRVYESLDALRAFGLPIYLPLPWKQTAQHDELLEICIRSGFDYGRCHRPDRVLEAMRRVADSDGLGARMPEASRADRLPAAAEGERGMPDQSLSRPGAGTPYDAERAAGPDCLGRSVLVSLGQQSARTVGAVPPGAGDHRIAGCGDGTAAAIMRGRAASVW